MARLLFFVFLSPRGIRHTTLLKKRASAHRLTIKSDNLSSPGLSPVSCDSPAKIPLAGIALTPPDNRAEAGLASDGGLLPRRSPCRAWVYVHRPYNPPWRTQFKPHLSPLHCFVCFLVCEYHTKSLPNYPYPATWKGASNALVLCHLLTQNSYWTTPGLLT